MEDGAGVSRSSSILYLPSSIFVFETSMIIVPLIPFRRRRKAGPAPTTPPVALTLVSASFDPDGPEVYLTFDRAIDIAGLIVGAFAVADGPDGHSLIGFLAPILLAPNEVQVLMQITGAASGDDVLLTAGAASGIVAVDDGGTWAGVSGLALPFG
jgi:hypothetical protein